MARRPKYEELVPTNIRKLAEGVGLPKPTWYEGRTNGHNDQKRGSAGANPGRSGGPTAPTGS